VHLGFPAQPLDAYAKGAAVGSYRLSEGVITVENGPETERKDGPIPKAHTHYPRMLKNGLIFQLPAVGCAVELADYHGKLAARIAQDWGSIHTLNSLEEERAPRAYSIVEALLLSEAISVPRHKRFSPNLARGSSIHLVTRQLVTALEAGRKGDTTIGSDAYHRVLSNILLQYSENATFLWHGASPAAEKTIFSIKMTFGHFELDHHSHPDH